MSKLIIDAFEFCRLKEQREGTMAIIELDRVRKEAPDEHRSVSWSIAGGADALGHPQLTLKVHGAVSLICQRCLSPVDVDVTSHSSLILAGSEEEADGIEALLADDTVDVVAITDKVDVTELIEDEILLAIPQAVKHAICPNDTTVLFEAVEKASAFDVLKNLKL